ncbi:hypothetical protein [Naasia sp. SYSU D00948]|uniref:hypothetical protein n=1 Tax=Naasia sp. SYSU D00948 TaxID=2817379 RepID=UPI001B3155F0|nr:hypothetical protein [Naasia sp. SYSU D00948]
MSDRISDHLNDDVSASDAVPTQSGAGGTGTPSIDAPGVALTGRPPMDLPVDENEDDTANPI